MGTCTDACDCYVEGARGLAADGIGTADDPYVVAAAAGRTVPITVASPGGLPTPGDDDIGMLAFVKSTGLLHIWAGATGAGNDTDWVPAAPRWSYATPAGITLSGTSTTATATGLRLIGGLWFVCVDVTATMNIHSPGEIDNAITTFVHDAASVVNLGSRYTQNSISDGGIGGFFASPVTLARICEVPFGADIELLVYANKSTAASDGALQDITMSAIQLTGKNLSDI